MKSPSLSILLLFCLTGSVSALQLPPHTPVPGGVAVLDLGTDMVPPTVRYHGRQVMKVRHAGHWWAVVGIALDAEPGLHRLQRSRPGMVLQPLFFPVGTKDYRAQYLELKDKNKVDPDERSLQRIEREARLRRQALDTWSDRPPVQLRFRKPSQGRYSSEFGLRRFFNGKPRRPHSGLDIAAPRGAPIVSASPGRVVATGDYFFNGKTVFVDHGQGLVTMYCHMERIDVRPGRSVAGGEILGSVGSSGRATGAHLHWSVSLNGVMVDPKLFLESP